MNAKMLDGKVAIVSGASYGMGYSMAELFAKEGARVVMTARGKEKLDAAVKRLRWIYMGIWISLLIMLPSASRK